MILLDTDVISELMRPEPAPVVLQWLSTQPVEHLCVAAITVAEIRRGLALLPDGGRRQKLESPFEHFLEQGFCGRILPFTESTVACYAPIYAGRVRAGFGVGELDLLLAAIAVEQSAAIATRNTADFQETGVRLINPWA